MAIENRNLKPGMKLVATFKKQDYTCEVVKTDDGLKFRLPDGKEFRSVSAAGSHVMGGTACNGWRFWSIESQSEQQAPYDPTTPKTTGTKRSPVKRTPKKAPEKATVAPGSPHGNSTQVNLGI